MATPTFTPNYVLNVKTINPDGTFEHYETWSEECHPAKSLAGRIIQSPTVESVFVGDRDGNHYLYLRKDAKGHIMGDKTENVSSTSAKYG